MAWYPPARTSRWSIRKGDKGHEVAALQLHLNLVAAISLVVDGDFGPATDAAVRKYQSTAIPKLVSDGIAGPATQRAIGLQTCALTSSAERLPVGLANGIAEGESGWKLGEASWLRVNNNDVVDCGLIQDSIVFSGQTISKDRWETAFGPRSCREAWTKIRQLKNTYYGKAGATTHQDAWYCAILYHNWPAAAERKARKTFDAWVYTARDQNNVVRWYGVDDEAWWVSHLGIPGVKTARQWCDHYVRTKTHYVTNWTP